MRVIKALLRLVGLKVKVEDAGACAVCGHGACPTLGVPLPTVDGTWKHLICMTVGRQIGAAASSMPAQASPAPAPPSTSRVRPPLIVAIVHPAGPEVWN